MQNQIKELRVKIDGLSQLTKELKQLHIGDKFIVGADNIVYRHKDIGEYWQSKKIEKAYDSLILAKAWLGKVLGELPNNGKIAIVTDLVRTAEQYIKENNLDLKNCVIVTDILHTRGYKFNDYKYLAISNKFYKDVKEVTGELEIDLAIHKFFTEVCEYVGNPYKNDGKRKTVEDIEPTADKARNLTVNIDGGWQEMTYIQKVDYLRQAINNLLKAPLLPFNRSTTFEVKHIYIEYAWKELQLARFWLGFELQRIKENESINKSSITMQ